jgi:hypothetical protein
MVAPESCKGTIEDRELFAAMDQQGAERLMHLVRRGEIDVRQRFYNIKQAPGLDVDARTPEDAAKDQQVVEEERHRSTAMRVPHFARARG